jgi:hypothetical protein
MKTKVFFLLCLFFGIGLTQLSAQTPPANNNGTGAVVDTRVYDNFGFPVFCEGVMVDILSGTIFIKEVIIWKNGVWIKGNHRYTGGDFKSLNSDEIFKVMIIDQCVNTGGINAGGTGSLKVNFIGDKGSHYIGTFNYTFPLGSLELVNTICN